MTATAIVVEIVTATFRSNVNSTTIVLVRGMGIERAFP